MRSLTLLLLGAGAPLAAQAAAGGVLPISLDAAIRLAQANAPAAVQARGQVRSSESQVKSAWSQFIPSLTVNTSSSAISPATSRVNTTTGELLPASKWQLTQGFSFGLILFNGGSQFNDLAAARASFGAAVASEDAQNWQVAYLVKQQYYGVLAAIEERRAAQAALDQASEQMKISVLRVQARTAIKSDSLQSLVQLGNAQLAMLTAENDLRSANASLTRLVASPRPVTAIAGDVGADSVLAVDSAQIAALALGGPAVRQATANLTAAQKSASAARGAWWPTLTASYGRNRISANPSFTLSPDSMSYSGQIRFALSYPIFDQWSRQQSITFAEVAASNADAALRDARFAAQQSLVQYLGALQTAGQQVIIQQTSVAAAEEALRVQEQRYQLGAGTILDELTSQTTLNQARFLLIQARFNYRVAKAQLEALIGRSL